jgi:hypothetical protein
MNARVCLKTNALPMDDQENYKDNVEELPINYVMPFGGGIQEKIHPLISGI